MSERGGWIVGTICGLILLVAAVAAWWAPPVLTAILVGLAVIVMSLWQLYRRGRDIPPVSVNNWVTIGVPLLFGGLAVVALNGWIMQISRGADGGESSTTATLVGLGTGVVFMASAYGYGRVRAQKVQISEQKYGETAAKVTADDDEIDPNEWLQNFDRREL